MKKIVEALQKQGIQVTENVPMREHTTFRIGGPATVCIPESTDELKTCIRLAQDAGRAFFVLGRGSNVLFADEAYKGLVIRLGNSFSNISINGCSVIAGAGASLKQLCLITRDAALTGLEFAYGIPGSVGGAVYMNAGAFDGEMSHVLKSVDCMEPDGTCHTLSADMLELGYRTSVFQKNGWCILAAHLELNAGVKEAITEKMEGFMRHRCEKQPLDKPSAGSTFKRPPGAFAGALIDQCGLRGYRIGDAAISDKHCGFVVNMGRATCADVLHLAENVVQIVKEKTGYVLEKEIRVIQ